jgi:hypothetical protein
MYDLDAIEAINIEQLVTATDRILLRGAMTGRPPTRRTVDIAQAAQLALALSAARRMAKAGVAEEETVHVRGGAPRGHWLRYAAIVGGAWLGVVCACLLA